MALSHISDQDISQDELKYLESEGRDYCLCHGMICRDSNGNMKHLPFTLYPSPFPQKLFNAAKEVQMDFQLLVHKVSQDYEFIKNALSWYKLYYVSDWKGVHDTRIMCQRKIMIIITCKFQFIIGQNIFPQKKETLFTTNWLLIVPSLPINMTLISSSAQRNNISKPMSVHYRYYNVIF